MGMRSQALRKIALLDEQTVPDRTESGAAQIRSVNATAALRFVCCLDTTGQVGSGDKRLLPHAIRLLRVTFGQWLEDKAPQLGAALAYYTVFSLAPMMLVLLAIFGLIYGNSEVARREILRQLCSFLDRSSPRPWRTSLRVPVSLRPVFSQP